MDNTPEQIVIQQLAAAIADAEETPPDRLDIPLHHYVSTEAIQNLVAHQSDSWRFQFESQNHVVEITGNNIIIVDGEQVREFS